VTELEDLDGVEVLAGTEIPEHERVRFVTGRRRTELAVEADEDAVVHVCREQRGGEDDSGWALALRAVGVRIAWIRARRTRQGKEGDERLHAAAADALAGVVVDVVVREAEVGHDAPEVGHGD